MISEVILSDSHKRGLIQVLSKFSKYHNNMPFKDLTRSNVIGLLESRRKTEAQNPMHKWIGTSLQPFQDPFTQILQMALISIIIFYNCWNLLFCDFYIWRFRIASVQIRRFAIKESELPDSIGLAHIGLEIQKKFSMLAKVQEETRIEQTSIDHLLMNMKWKNI